MCITITISIVIVKRMNPHRLDNFTCINYKIQINLEQNKNAGF